MSHHRAGWLNHTVRELALEDRAGLVMEFVALRPIRAGEEIFVDYGDGWERAWEGHVERWEEVKRGFDPTFTSAVEMNEEHEPLRTMEEQEEDGYPDNVMVVCYVAENIRNGDENIDDGDELTYDWEYEPRLFDFADWALPCDILRRYDEDNVSSSSIRPLQDFYDVLVLRPDDRSAFVLKGEAICLIVCLFIC